MGVDDLRTIKEKKIIQKKKRWKSLSKEMMQYALFLFYSINQPIFKENQQIIKHRDLYFN